MRYLSIFFITIFFWSCSDNYQELRQDIFIQKFFDRDQSKDLARLVKFFDEKVCNTVGRNGIQGLVCYKEWFNKTSRFSSDSIPLLLNAEDQWNFSKTLYQETIDVIWEIENPNTSGLYNTLPRLALKKNGAYLKWLRAFAEEDGLVKEYYDQVMKNGLRDEESRVIFHKSFVNWPVSDPRYRLVIAIDRLTIQSHVND